MLYGRTNAAMASRFLREIPEDITVKKGGFSRYGEQSSFETRNYLRPAQPAYKSEYRPAQTQAKPAIELSKGDMVEHTAFGRGLVLSVLKMSGDALLEIAFDRVGTKKLMAKAASAHMKKL